MRESSKGEKPVHGSTPGFFFLFLLSLPSILLSSFRLENVFELGPAEAVVALVGNVRVGGNKSVLGANVERVVNAPVHCADLARRMEQALQRVGQNLCCAESDTHATNGIHDGTNHVRRCFENVGPDEVEEVDERVLRAKAVDAKRHVLNGRGSSLGLAGYKKREKVSVVLCETAVWPVAMGMGATYA